MRYRPFLSHKREQANTVAYLKQQLCIRGGGGWKDTDDIPLGDDFIANCVASIEHETGGFIWWGTKETLGSSIICKTELPTALERAKRDPTYPVVPVLVDLQPGDDSAAIGAAIGSAYARQLLSSNGILHRNGQSLRALARETARRYVKQLVRGLPDGPVDVAITAFRAPTEQHDLTLDWRPLFNQDTRELAAGAEKVIVEALADIRTALQARERSPEVHIELALPLPLAMLIGHEWRWTTQLKATAKTVNPATGQMLTVPPGGARSELVATVSSGALAGKGPFVLALSVGTMLGNAVERYADEHDACGFEEMHVDCDASENPLEADDIRSLAAQVVKRLNEVHATGTEKHLLLRAPASLALAIGLAGNGTGPTWVPFYDGHDYYVSGLNIG
jgi:hypothetical protein